MTPRTALVALWSLAAASLAAGAAFVWWSASTRAVLQRIEGGVAPIDQLALSETVTLVGTALLTGATAVAVIGVNTLRPATTPSPRVLAAISIVGVLLVAACVWLVAHRPISRSYTEDDVDAYVVDVVTGTLVRSFELAGILAAVLAGVAAARAAGRGTRAATVTAAIVGVLLLAVPPVLAGVLQVVQTTLAVGSTLAARDARAFVDAVSPQLDLQAGAAAGLLILVWLLAQGMTTNGLRMHPEAVSMVRARGGT